jgi:thiamine biosynthesis protein ThiS
LYLQSGKQNLENNVWKPVSGKMTLQINGENREFGDGILLSALFEQMGMKADRVAVERNGEIVPRGRWRETALADGDRLEIVHFVGGGSASLIPRSGFDLLA